jgi:hypothetical protein
MAEGTFVAAPKPCVVGVGLDKVQEAFDAQKGVSARHIVVCIVISFQGYSPARASYALPYIFDMPMI